MLVCATSSFAGSVIVPDHFATIQEAIDSGAEEILIRPGIYAEVPVLTRELDLRGLVPPGAPPDSFPVLDGLLFDDVPGELLHEHVTHLVNLRFAGPVRNDYQKAPFWDPWGFAFQNCVFEASVHDSTATSGGQLEYYFGACRFEGPLSLDNPQAVWITNSTILAPVFVDRADQFYMRNNRLQGASGIGVDLRSIGDFADFYDNTFEGFDVAVRSRSESRLSLSGNTFRGPGGRAVDSDREVSAHRNRISDYGVGLYLTGGEQGALWTNANRIERCTTAGMLVESGYVDCERDTVLECGVGMMLSAIVEARLRSNVILGSDGDGMRLRVGGGNVDSNVVGRSGGDGIDMTLVPFYSVWIRIRNNTSFSNDGSGLRLALSGGYSPDEVTGNIGYGNGQYGVEVVTQDSLLRSCNDWFANALGAVSGIDPAPTDLAVDPAFCGVGADDVTLRSDSPLADAAGCGLVGARSVGCDTTTTPALVQRFEATRTPDGSIVVRWIVHLEVRLERAPRAEGPWTRVEGLPEHSGDLVTLVDGPVMAGEAIWYRLVAQNDLVLATTHVAADLTANSFELEGPAGSPGAGPFTIRFRAPRAAQVEIAAFDLQGRRVARLASGEWPEGRHELHWTPAHAGLHFVRYRYPGGEATRRISVVR